MRLAKEALAQEENAPKGTDLESAMEDTDEDKTYAAMGMAKTIGTVSSGFSSSFFVLEYAAPARSLRFNLFCAGSTNSINVLDSAARFVRRFFCPDPPTGAGGRRSHHHLHPGE